MDHLKKLEAEISWEIADSEEKELCESWDNLLHCASDSNVFQSLAWGRYKNLHGWSPVRCIGRDKGGRVVGMVQILFKKLPFGIHFGWAAGGPILQFKGWTYKSIGKVIDTLREALTNKYGTVVLRFHSHIKNDPEFIYTLSGRLRRPIFKVTSEFSEFLDLDLTVEEFEKSMTSKHRYYVKQSLGHEISWRYGRDTALQEELARLHAEMATEKGVEHLKAGIEDIRNTCSILGEQALIFTGYFKEEAVTSCLVLMFGKIGFYATAATGKRGRELSAAYAMIYRLLPILREKGLTRLNFAGLDPKTPAAFGVNHFKRGFGGQLVEYVGEWEWASSEVLRWGINFAIWKKGGQL
jgi:lipid II:glycine glycyltransferase (peptidoglycan interpeptide bridge formation enzyme)